MLPSGIYVSCGDPFSDKDKQAALDLSVFPPPWSDEIGALSPWKKSAVENVFTATANATDECNPIIIMQHCHSTMDEAFTFANNATLPPWGSVIALSQTQGRGQLRRTWTSPFGNLYASLILPKHDGLSLPWQSSIDTLLPLVLGYVFCSALKELGMNTTLKWPNDFLVNERKVGGMLLEDRAGIKVLGLGLNIISCPTDSEMREDSALRAGLLPTNEKYNSPLSIWKNLVNRGETIYKSVLEAFSPTSFITVAEAHLAWIGRKVRVHEGNSYYYQARIKGLSPEGSLILEQNGKEIRLNSGSLLPV